MRCRMDRMAMRFLLVSLTVIFICLRQIWRRCLALVMSCFVMALMAVFAPARSIFMGPVATLTLITSALITIAHRWIIKKFGVKWLSNFVMADALILGMVSAVFWNALLS